MEAYAITASKLLALVKEDGLAAQTALAIAKNEGIELTVTLDDDLEGWLVCLDKACERNNITIRDHVIYKANFMKAWLATCPDNL